MRHDKKIGDYTAIIFFGCIGASLSITLIYGRVGLIIFFFGLIGLLVSMYFGTRN